MTRWTRLVLALVTVLALVLSGCSSTRKAEEEQAQFLRFLEYSLEQQADWSSTIRLIVNTDPAPAASQATYIRKLLAKVKEEEKFWNLMEYQTPELQAALGHVRAGLSEFRQFVELSGDAVEQSNPDMLDLADKHQSKAIASMATALDEAKSAATGRK